MELPAIEWEELQKSYAEIVSSHYQEYYRVLLPISVTNVKQLNSGVNQKCPKTAVRSQAADSEFIYSDTAEIMLMALS